MKCLWFWILKKPIRFKCSENINATALICIHRLPRVHLGSAKEKHGSCLGGMLALSAGSSQGDGGMERMEGQIVPPSSCVPGHQRDGDFQRHLCAGKTLGFTTSRVKTHYSFAGKFRHFKTWFAVPHKGNKGLSFSRESKSRNNFYPILFDVLLNFCSFNLMM